MTPSNRAAMVAKIARAVRIQLRDSIFGGITAIEYNWFNRTRKVLATRQRYQCLLQATRLWGLAHICIIAVVPVQQQRFALAFVLIIRLVVKSSGFKLWHVVSETISRVFATTGAWMYGFLTCVEVLAAVIISTNPCHPASRSTLLGQILLWRGRKVRYVAAPS
jgi:hypothetical protein